MPNILAIPGQQLNFADLLVNSTVPPDDELRLSRQAEKMLQLFVLAYRVGRDVSNGELREIGQQHNARLFEVRRYLVSRGFCIDLIRRGPGGVNFYRLLPIEKSDFYRKHREKLEMGGPWR